MESLVKSSTLRPRSNPQRQRLAKEAALHLCSKSQRLRLARVTAHRSKSVAFWIDSLCVPRESSSKSKAIGLMTKTYAQATATLVIDAGIRACPQHAQREEKSLRIVASNWMQRLWTLQEAVLARKLAFQFQGGFTFVSDDDVISLPDSADCLDIKGVALSSKIGLLHPCGGATLRDIISSICWRSTSKEKDETLAIAGLLDVPVAELLRYKDHPQRMKEFYLRLGRRIPADIIFLDGPKLTEKGFRWAPLTLMTHSGLMIKRVTGAECTPDGLLAEYVGITLRTCIVIDKHTGSEYVLEDRIQNCAFHVKTRCCVEWGRAFNLLLFIRLPNSEGKEAMTCSALMTSAVESDGRVVCNFRETHFHVEGISMVQASKIRVGTDGFPIKRIFARVGNIPVKLV